MKMNKMKIWICALSAVLLLSMSLAYKVFIFEGEAAEVKKPEFAEGRQVVSLWIKDSYYADKVRENVEDYNLVNKDKIYIDLRVEGGDYFNLLRLSMRTENNPDIFQYGFYDLLREEKLKDISTLDIDFNSIDKSRLFTFKSAPLGVNISGNNVKLVWNKEILRKSGLNPDAEPKTWAEVLEYARKIKSKFPDITPLEFPAASYYNLKVSVGQNSSDPNSKNTTFWNPSLGAYDFTSSKEILEVYRTMYSEGLIPKDFDQIDKKAVRDGFYAQETAMIISTYEDKLYFLTGYPIDFDFGISELPKFEEGQSKTYYFTEEVATMVVSASSEKDEAVSKVYDWFVKMSTEDNKLEILQFKSDRFPKFAEYDDASNFKFESNDPTPFLSFSHRPVNEAIWQAIKGEVEVNEAVNNLNKYFSDYCETVKKVDADFFENYTVKE
jgi:multiple sugar transport system substrate-binding protein